MVDKSRAAPLRIALPLVLVLLSSSVSLLIPNTRRVVYAQSTVVCQ